MEIQKTTRKIKETGRRVAGKVRGQQKSDGARENERTVKFTYYMPDAGQVCVAGGFNDWDTAATPMKRDKDGTWTLSMKLAAGSYEYNFYVDGAWVKDPACNEIVANPFGTYNCVIRVE